MSYNYLGYVFILTTISALNVYAVFNLTKKLMDDPSLGQKVHLPFFNFNF